MLVEQGKLAWDRTLAEIFPEAPRLAVVQVPAGLRRLVRPLGARFGLEQIASGAGGALDDA